MGSIIAAVVALLEEIIPLVNNAGTVAKVVGTLVSLIPSLVQEAKDMVQPVKNIIAALSANPATTAEQLQALQDLDAKVDADFEAAATAAQAEDNPPAA